jgi:16S rRNA (adenine1518-N6/adenine1519-N6)-dimethyltransferase
VQNNGTERDLLTETKSLLRLFNIHPNRKLGQNFVINLRIIKRLVGYADIAPTESVLEVGAGLGYLTEALVKKARKVITVEIDPKLIEILHKKFQYVDNLKILSGDILSIELPEFDKIVSTPPYKISSPLLFKIFGTCFEKAVFVLQEEFSNRLRALPGDAEYSRLSVMTQLRVEVEVLDSISSKMFYPKPEVSSSVVRFSPKSDVPDIANSAVFGRLLRGLFSQRKRRLRKAIIPFLKYDVGLGEKEITNLRQDLPMMTRRVFTLTPEEFIFLAEALSEKIGSC